MNQDLEQLVFHYILGQPELCEKCYKEFFSISYISELFDVLKPHVLRYKVAPSAEQTIQLVNISSDITQEVKEYLTPEIIRQFWNIADAMNSYDKEWIDQSARAFISWQGLMKGVNDGIAYIKTVRNDVNVENYQEYIERARLKLTKGTEVTFTDMSKGMNFYDPESHKTKNLIHWSTGYPFLDRATKGGYWGGSLWCFLGAPKAGKSRLLQNLCAEAIKRGQHSAYASFELQEEIVNQRIGSNLFNIKMDDYDAVSADEALMVQKIKSFLTDDPLMKRGYLDVKSFPTSAFGVNELEMWLLGEEERISAERGKPFKFKNIFVDYINIMKNWRNPNSENTYMKIKQIAEDLRAMAMRNKWCIITVTQVKQSFFNASDMDMSAASESSALSATVDFMGGIITDVFLQASHELFLKSILSRVTPHINEKKKFSIEEDYMRIKETDEEIIKDENVLTNKNFVASSNKIIQAHQASPQMIINPNTPTTVTANLSVGTEITGEGLFN